MLKPSSGSDKSSVIHSTVSETIKFTCGNMINSVDERIFSKFQTLLIKTPVVFVRDQIPSDILEWYKIHVFSQDKPKLSQGSIGPHEESSKSTENSFKEPLKPVSKPKTPVRQQSNKPMNSLLNLNQPPTESTEPKIEINLQLSEESSNDSLSLDLSKEGLSTDIEDVITAVLKSIAEGNSSSLELEDQQQLSDVLSQLEAGQSIDQPLDQPLDQLLGLPSNQPLDKPPDQPSDQPLDQLLDQLQDQSLDQPMDQSMDKSTDQSTVKAMEQNDQSMDQPIGQSTNQEMDKTMIQSEQAMDKTADQIDQPMDQSIDQPEVQPPPQSLKRNPIPFSLQLSEESSNDSMSDGDTTVGDKSKMDEDDNDVKRDAANDDKMQNIKPKSNVLETIDSENNLLDFEDI